MSERDGNRKLALLVAIHLTEKPTMVDLVAATKIPKRTIHSMMSQLKETDVVITRVGGRRHGHYRIADPGVYNMQAVQAVIKRQYPGVYMQIATYAAEQSMPAKVAGQMGNSYFSRTPMKASNSN